MARKSNEPTDTEPDADWATVVGGPGELPSRTPAAAATRSARHGESRREGSPRGTGRPWLILAMSFVVQLAVVLAAGSTGVVDRGLRYSANHDTLLGTFATLPGVLAWRLTPPAVDASRVYPARLFGLLALFVVAALLTFALVRGAITFWRAFVGIALSVIVATLVAGMIERGIVRDTDAYDRFGGKVGSVLFAGSGYEVVAGAIVGVLAGLVGAIVAVISRRPAVPVLPLEAPPEPYAASYAEPAAPPPWHGPDPNDTQPTARFSAVPAASSPGRSDFPRPPDDEDLGHHQEHED